MLKSIVFSIIILLALAVNTAAQNVEGRVIPDAANQLKNPLPKDNKTTMQGARIYKKVCWVCHGDNGAGDGPQAIELENKPADFKEKLVVERTDGALFWWISNGGSDMQPFKELLSEKDRWKVVNYVRKLQNQ